MTHHTGTPTGEQSIVGERHGGRRASTQTFFGNEPQAEIAPSSGAPMVDTPAAQGDGAFVGAEGFTR